MRILEVCDDFPPNAVGGIGRVSYALAQEWRRMGFDVHVLAVRTDGRISRTVEEGLVITRVPVPRFPPRSVWFQIARGRQITCGDYALKTIIRIGAKSKKGEAARQQSSGGQSN